MTAEAIQRREAVDATQHENNLVRAWAKRRPAWTRTDSARWLNDRSEQVLAWLRRRSPHGAPGHSRQMGYWVKDNEPDLFARAHERLAASVRTDRDQLLTSEVLR